jgi:hypothetical protein
MLYLLDANVLIDAGRDYYPLEMVPEFWDWIAHQASIGNIKLPLEIYEEICDGRDAVAEWLARPEIKSVIVFVEEADAAIVNRVVAEGYAPDLTDDELLKVGRDPFLVAYALAATSDRCVVTTESSRPSAQRANRKVPDVCSGLGVDSCNTFELIRRLGFRTSWRTSNPPSAA